MEFGLMPPLFGMGIVHSLSELVKIQQQGAEQALAQMQMQAQRDAMQPSQPAEPPLTQPENLSPQTR